MSSRFESERKDAISKERARSQKELAALQSAKSDDENLITLLQVHRVRIAVVGARARGG